MLHERLGFSPDVIEAQLAHSVRDSLGRAYNRTEFVEQRREMLQTWADYLDELRSGATVAGAGVAAPGKASKTLRRTREHPDNADRPRAKYPAQAI